MEINILAEAVKTLREKGCVWTPKPPLTKDSDSLSAVSDEPIPNSHERVLAPTNLYLYFGCISILSRLTPLAKTSGGPLPLTSSSSCLVQEGRKPLLYVCGSGKTARLVGDSEGRFFGERVDRPVCRRTAGVSNAATGEGWTA